MVEFKGKYIGIVKDLNNNVLAIHLEIAEPDKVKLIDSELTGKGELAVTIKKYKEKRSLDANAYAWKLITEIANKTRESKDSVYVNMLEHYGQSNIVSVSAEIDVSRFFKYYKEVGRGYVKDKEFIHYKVLIGSSQYDTLEMGILIDGIIQEAEQLGIQTMTPAELQVIKML